MPGLEAQRRGRTAYYLAGPTELTMARVLVIEHDQAWQQVASEGLNAHRLEICPALTDAGRLLEKESFG